MVEAAPSLASDVVEEAAKRMAAEVGAEWPQDANRYRRLARAALTPARMKVLEEAHSAALADNARMREALEVAKRAILQAAKDTLWCDDSPAETVVDRIDDALLATPKSHGG